MGSYKKADIGILSGTVIDGNLYFKPDESIKMSEAAVIISNMIGYADPKISQVFADAGQIPVWSSKAIQSLHALGILEVSDMVSGVMDTLTCGDMAKLINRTIFVINK